MKLLLATLALLAAPIAPGLAQDFLYALGIAPVGV